MWTTPDIVLALFALGGAGATVLMFLAASKGCGSHRGCGCPARRFRAGDSDYGKIPLSRRYAADDALYQ